MVKALLPKGAKVIRVGGLGITPLHYAATVDYADPRVTELLLAAGAETEAKDK